MKPQDFGFVAIDLGATSGRVILATLTGENIIMEELHRFPNKLINIGGKYYWNIYALYEEILHGLVLAGNRNVSIKSIGIDTWGVDFVHVAADGTFSGLPRAYRDPYTNGMPEKFFAQMSSKEVYMRTGIQIMNFNSLYQLYAQRKENSSALSVSKKILFMPDALSYMLTGEMVCEYTILSTSQLLNPYTQDVDEMLLSRVKLTKSHFPPIVMPGAIIGMLSPSLAKMTQLGNIPVVAVPGHDTASAVVAVPAENGNFAYLSSGTWSLMGIELHKPHITDDAFVMNFTNEGGVDGTTRYLKNITGMWLLEQCREAWKKDEKDYAYSEIMNMVKATSPAVGIIDPDAQEFAAPTDMPNAICQYCRKNGLAVPENDAQLMRLIFDSLAIKYAEVLNKLRQVAPFEIETLHVIGGGAQNSLLNQMTADKCGIPVVAGPSEATALGNIMIQARAAGLVNSLTDIRRYIMRSVNTTRYEPSKYK